jgi:hypothetical protein
VRATGIGGPGLALEDRVAHRRSFGGRKGFTSLRSSVYQVVPLQESDMKKQETVLKKRLQFSRETVRELNAFQLKELVGGGSLPITTTIHSRGLICEF